MWLISDGAGRLFIISVASGTSSHLSGTVLAYYEITEAVLKSDDNTLTNILKPLRIYDAFILQHSDGRMTVQVVVATKLTISRSTSNVSSSKTVRSSHQPQTRFQLTALHLDVPSMAPDDPLSTPLSPTLYWSVFGDDLPLTLNRLEEGAYAAFASSLYHPHINPELINKPRDPLPEEIAPIPRAGENFDAHPLKPPLYSWTQMGDSITVAFEGWG